MDKVRFCVRKNLSIVPDFGNHINNEDSVEIRPYLHVSWAGDNKGKVVAIGINPSTAKAGKSDNTLSRLCRLVDMYGYCDLSMINLFESSSPDQREIVVNTETDFENHRKLFDEADIILIVWGLDNSKYRKQKAKAHGVLKEYYDKLFCIQDLKNGDLRKPLHPSRIAYTAEIAEYDIRQ